MAGTRGRSRGYDDCPLGSGWWAWPDPRSGHGLSKKPHKEGAHRHPPPVWLGERGARRCHRTRATKNFCTPVQKIFVTEGKNFCVACGAKNFLFFAQCAKNFFFVSRQRYKKKIFENDKKQSTRAKKH